MKTNETPSAPAARKKTATARAKSGYRLPPLLRARLILDLILTNKTQKMLSAEYGIDRSNISRLSKKLKSKNSEKILLFKKDFKPFFQK